MRAVSTKWSRRERLDCAAVVAGVYFMFVMIMCCLELALTILVMNLHNRATSEPLTAMPLWVLSRPYIDCFAKVLGWYEITYLNQKITNKQITRYGSNQQCFATWVLLLLVHYIRYSFSIWNSLQTVLATKSRNCRKISKKLPYFGSKIFLGGPQRLLPLILPSGKVWLTVTFVDLRVLGLG